MLDRCAIVHYQIHFFAANVIGRICKNVTHAGTHMVSAGFCLIFCCCNLWSQPITILKLLCFRFRIAEQQAAMVVKWTNKRLKGVGGRSALAENSAAEKKEEVASGNWSKNFIWLLLTIFLTFILAFFLMLFIILWGTGFKLIQDIFNNCLLKKINTFWEVMVINIDFRFHSTLKVYK